MTRAPQRAGDFHGIIAGCRNRRRRSRRRTARTRGNPRAARAASRVITQRLKGSGPDMRVTSRASVGMRPRAESTTARILRAFARPHRAAPRARRTAPGACPMSARPGRPPFVARRHRPRAGARRRRPRAPPGARDRLGGRGGVRPARRARSAACGASFPVALRRWRHAPLAPATWREIAAFRRELRARTLRRRARSAGAGQGRADRAARARARGTARTARASASRSRRSLHDAHHRDRSARST